MERTPERRNDTGAKIQYAILTTLIAALISIFVIGAFTRADVAKEKAAEACSMAVRNEDRIIRQSQDISEIKTDVKEIKRALIR